MALPVADPWYGTHQIDERIWCITEPHVHPIFSANIHLVTGRDADLLIDSGMGVAPLRPVADALRGDPSKPLILFTTHTHIDHIGAAHEFDIRLVHPAEAEILAKPEPASLDSNSYSEPLVRAFEEAGYPPLWPLLVDAVPHAGYDPATYVLRGAAPTGTLVDGDRIDLGDWTAEVLHLPGHAAGQIGLWHSPTGTLFGADAIYDGPLLCFDGAPGMNIADYAQTLRRIGALPIQRVLGGHDDPFGPERCAQIIADYLRRWDA